MSNHDMFREELWFLHDGLHTWKTFILKPDTDDGIRHLWR